MELLRPQALQGEEEDTESVDERESDEEDKDTQTQGSARSTQSGSIGEYFCRNAQVFFLWEFSSSRVPLRPSFFICCVCMDKIWYR